MARRPEYLFHHNPPIDPEVSNAVFYNRNDEIQEAIHTLDVPDLAPLIYAVHGDSRTGKSHLVQRVLRLLANRFVNVTVNANAAGDARAALERAFFALKTELDGLSNLAPDDDGMLAHDVVDPWRRYFDGMAPLIEGRVDEVTLKVSKTIRDQVTGKLGLPPLSSANVSLELSQTLEVARTDEHSLTIKKPLDRVLVLHLRELVDVLFYATRRRVLLYFDDLDLLALGGMRGPATGQKEAAQLLHLLGPLAESPRVAVIGSMRTAFFQVGDKALRDFAHVRKVGDGFLRNVYRLHVEQLNDGIPVFTDACLEAIIRMSAGRVGVFLRLCERVVRFARRKTPVDVEHLDGWLSQEIEDWTGTPETAQVVGRIVEAVQSGALEVPGEGIDVEDGPLAFTLVRRGDRGKVEVVERTARLIRERVADRG